MSDCNEGLMEAGFGGVLIRHESESRVRGQNETRVPLDAYPVALGCLHVETIPSYQFVRYMIGESALLLLEHNSVHPALSALNEVVDTFCYCQCISKNIDVVTYQRCSLHIIFWIWGEN